MIEGPFRVVPRDERVHRVRVVGPRHGRAGRVDLDVLEAVTLEVELADHRRRAERHVVAAAHVDHGPGERLAGGGAADVGARLEQERRSARPGEIGGGHQSVVPGTDDDGVDVVVGARHAAIVPARRRTHPRYGAAREWVRPPAEPSACPRGAERADRAQRRRAAARRHRAARPAPPARHRPARGRRRGRRRGRPSGRRARRVAAAAARRTPSPTSTPGRRARSGCRPTTLLAVLDDIGRCVAMTAGPASSSFFNGHGGNSALLGVANRELRLQSRADDVPRPSRRAAPTRAAPLGRPTSWAWACTAAPTRRRSMLHLRPELVDMTAAAPQRARAARPPTATSASAAGSLRLAVERLRPDGRDRRPTGGDRRAGQGAVRGRGHRVRLRRWPRSPPSSYRGDRRRARHDLRVDGGRLLARASRRSAEIGAIEGPNGEHGLRRAWRSPTPTARAATWWSAWMRDLGLDVPIDEIGNVVATRAGTRSGRRAGDDRHRTSTPCATGGRFDGNLGVLAGLEVIETLEHARHRHRPPDRRRLLHRRGGRPLRARHARQPRVRRRAWRWRRRSTSAPPIDGARLGDELARIGYAGPLPCPAAAAPHAYVELHIEQGPVLEDEGVTIGVVDRRAGDLVDRADDRRPVGPRRHHADARCGTTPATSPRRSPRSCGDLAARPRRRTRWPPSAASSVRPEPRQRRARAAPLITIDLRNTDERRPASRPRPRSPPRSSAERGRAGHGRRRARWPASSRSTSTRRSSTSSSAPPQRLGHSTRAAAERAPATTPRCWPGSARRR